ncbi:MAG: M48 family metallopeptidase [Myxococcota bacterium]|nr:M48 family metallopeptidase [Myxococcota bacterium]
MRRDPQNERRGPARRSSTERQLAFSFDATCASASAPILGPLAIATIAPLPPATLAPTAATQDAARREELARHEIERTMTAALGVQVRLELTRNRRTMISTARAPDAMRVRLHRMFTEADAAIVAALGRYVKSGDRRASRELGAFIEARREQFVAERKRPVLRSEGRQHDLAAIFVDIEARHFPGQVSGVEITWGRSGAPGRGRRRKRTIRLGTYTHDERLIRVHPVLDQPWVPRSFVEYIVFHEMLHHVEPAREEQGRTLFHTPEFRRRERAYPGYEQALAWEQANIRKLLST